MTPEDKLRRMMAGVRRDDGVTESEWEGFAFSARRSLRVRRIVAGAVAVIVLGGAAAGATAILGDFGGDKKMPPTNSQTPSGCLDIDAPKNPQACNYAPQPSRAPSPPLAPSPTLPSGIDEKPPPLVEHEIWLVDPKTKRLSWGTRVVPGGDKLTVVLEELLRGPIGPDVESGFVTEIPKGTELVDTEVVGDVAHIVLSEEFAGADRAPRATTYLRGAQVVFTATQIEGVDSVRLFVEEASGGASAYLADTEPKGRGDYPDVAPVITLDAPKANAELTSPTQLEGSFISEEVEDAVRIKLDLSPPKTFTVSNFGAGLCLQGPPPRGICRVEFSEEIEFEVEQRTNARLVVYEDASGSALHTISLPVVLLPD